MESDSETSRIVFCQGAEAEKRTAGRNGNDEGREFAAGEDIKDLKLLLSSQLNFVKGNTDEVNLDVANDAANGNAVANNNKVSLSVKQKMDSQLSEVRNAFKLRYYNGRTTIAQECEPIQPTTNLSIEKDDIPMN